MYVSFQSPESSFVIIIHIIQDHTDHVVNNAQLPLITKKKNLFWQLSVLLTVL